MIILYLVVYKQILLMRSSSKYVCNVRSFNCIVERGGSGVYEKIFKSVDGLARIFRVYTIYPNA